MRQRRIQKRNHTSRESIAAQAEPKKDVLAEIITHRQRIAALLRESNDPYAMVGSALLFPMICYYFFIGPLRFLINDPAAQEVQTLLLKQQSLQQQADDFYNDVQYNLDELGVYICGPVFEVVRQISAAIDACFTAGCRDNAYFFDGCFETIARGIDKLSVKITEFGHAKNRFHQVALQLIAVSGNDPYFKDIFKMRSTINPTITSFERYAEFIDRGSVNLDIAIDYMSEMDVSAKLTDLDLRFLLFNRWSFLLSLALTFGGRWLLNNMAHHVIPASWHLVTPLPEIESIDFLTGEEARKNLKTYKRIEHELTEKIKYSHLLAHIIFVPLILYACYECFFGEAKLPLPLVMVFFQLPFLGIRTLMVEIQNVVNQHTLGSKLVTLQEKLTLMVEPLAKHGNDSVRIILNREKSFSLSSFTINVRGINFYFEEKKFVVKAKTLVRSLRNCCVLYGAYIINFTRSSLTIGTKSFNNAETKSLFARALDRLRDAQVLTRQLLLFSAEHPDLGDPFISLVEDDDHLPVVEARFPGKQRDATGQDDIAKQLQQIFQGCKVQCQESICIAIGCKPGAEADLQSFIANLHDKPSVSSTRESTHDYCERSRKEGPNLRKHYSRRATKHQEGNKEKKIIRYRELIKKPEPQTVQWEVGQETFIFNPNDKACPVVPIDSRGYFPAYTNFVILLLTEKHFKKKHEDVYKVFQGIAKDPKMNSNCKLVVMHELDDYVHKGKFTARLELKPHGSQFGKMRAFAKRIEAPKTGENLFAVVAWKRNPPGH